MNDKKATTGIIDFKSLKDAKVPLPKGVIHIPKSPHEEPSFPDNHTGLGMVFLMLTALCCVQVHIAFAFWLGVPTSLILLFGFQHRKAKETTKRLPPKRRNGLFIGPNEIWLNEYSDRWKSIDRSENVTIRCWPKIGILDLVVLDKDENHLKTLSLRNIDKGQALTAVEDWLRKCDGSTRDPTDADLQGRWLALIEDLYAYRGWLPDNLLAETPQYPFLAEDLRAFTEKLKQHKHLMKRRDTFLTLRTLGLCIACIGGMAAAGIWNHSDGAWKWGFLAAPTLFYIWITQGRLRRFQQDRAAEVFKAHLWWGLSLTGFAWLSML